MGRQFQVYLLPSDAVSLVEVLRRKVDLRLLPHRLNSAELVEITSPIVTTPAQYTGIQCLLVPDLSVVIQTRHVETQGYWSIDITLSEVVQFSGCFLRPDKKSFDRGRLFYETGFYNQQGDWQEKSPQFLRWAEAVFRLAKKSLKRYPGLDAYVGEDAERWRAAGGLFIAMAIKGRPPIIAK